ncbi:MAG: hypothetical protein JW800_06810 [Candidatus Omnitrophica bacterium]|nr:hypothetical protein [Candidatus Omnitrophota bacterium]
MLILLYPYLKKKGLRITAITRCGGKSIAATHGISVYKGKRAYSGYRSILNFVRQKRPDCIITGTSLYDNLERNYIKAAKDLGIPSLSFVDWWTSYRRRFTHSKTGKLCIPDRIAVVDDNAKGLCRKELGGKGKIVIAGNPYFSHVARRAAKKTFDRKKTLKRLGLSADLSTILYLADPVKTPGGFNPFDIFRQVAREAFKAAAREMNFIIRMHPRADVSYIRNRYMSIAKKELTERFNIRLIGGDYTIGELIDCADYVWGTNTTPLLEAMMRGRVVTSFLDRACPDYLPFAKSASYCPSAEDYKEYPSLIRNLLTNKKFVKNALARQMKYRIPVDILGKKVCEIVAEGA